MTKQRPGAMKRLLILTTSLFLLTVALTEAQTVRLLFYSGDVKVKTSSGTKKARLGQSLEKRDRVILGRGATAQLSVDGKVLKYRGRETVQVSSAISRAGSGKSSVVANSARTIAGASGVGRRSRSSVAGATRATDDPNASPAVIDTLELAAVNRGNAFLDKNVGGIVGVADVGAVVTSFMAELKGEPIVILQPRSTAVPAGPIRFRWLNTPDVSSYQVSVLNHVGDTIWSRATTDTVVIWEDPDVVPEAVYTWHVGDEEGSRTYAASFYRLSDAENRRLEEGLAEIREELGEDNPALEMVVGGHMSDFGCYGEAAARYEEQARVSSEHDLTFRQMACEEYLYRMYVPLEEAMIICGSGSGN